MSTANAAGRKTELAGLTARLQQSIEEQVASLAQGVADCMENARNTTPRSTMDDSRSVERRDAVQMVSSTAELLSAIAKLRGEFSHNYHVTRVDQPLQDQPVETAPAETLPPPMTPDKTQAELDAMEDDEYFAYWAERNPAPPPSRKRGSNG
jgi:hypothetical protein